MKTLETQIATVDIKYEKKIEKAKLSPEYSPCNQALHIQDHRRLND